MRFSILGFNQERVLSLSAVSEKQNGEKVLLSLDICDLLILNLIADFPNRTKVKKIMKGDKIYFWASYEEILNELPLLNIKKQALANRFDKMEKLHVIEREYLTINSKNNLTFFCLTKIYESLLYNGELPPIVSKYDTLSYPNTIPSDIQIRDSNNNIYDNKTDDKRNINKESGGNLKTLEERQQLFYNSLVPFVGKYPKEMVREFYDYWTEPNRLRTKMRFEMQKTWETGRRLTTWANNDKNYNHTNRYDQRIDDIQRRQDGAAAIIARLAAEENNDAQ